MGNERKLLVNLKNLLDEEASTFDITDEIGDFIKQKNMDLPTILKEEIQALGTVEDVIEILERTTKVLKRLGSNPPEPEAGYIRAFQNTLDFELEKMNEALSRLVNLHQEEAPFSVSAWVEKEGGAESLGSTSNIKEEHYKIGDSILIKFEAEHDCHLTLVNIGPEGHITLLFPNKYRQDNYIKGGEVQVIPEDDWGFKYRLVEPAGTERLKAIATLEKIQLTQRAMRSTSSTIFRSIPRGFVAQDIGEYVEKILKLPKDQWADDYHEFIVDE